MDVRIADTFTSSLARLTLDEQKQTKTTAFDLQLDPSNPGIRMHRIERTRGKNFWSARISKELRLILHRTASSLLLCYVDHHDEACRWAERRFLEPHPKTGAAAAAGGRAGGTARGAVAETGAPPRSELSWLVQMEASSD